MNRNIWLLSLSVAGFFLLISFLLRMIFFIDYFSLITHPLLVFTGWFILTSGILFFLKHDFVEIYKLLNFFNEKKDETMNTNNSKISSKTSSKSSKKLDIQDEVLEEYSNILQKQESNQADKQADFKNVFTDQQSIMNYSSNEFDVSQSDVSNNFSKTDPKLLAKVVKNYLNE